jgi:hypothetical protein
MTITYHYEATFKDGTIARRKSPRVYTHAINWPTNTCRGQSYPWSGSLGLARNAARGREIAEAVVVKTTGN